MTLEICWPDPSWADSVKCWPDPPWSDKVIKWLPSGQDYAAEFIRPGDPRFMCDASRLDWRVIFEEWKERKRLYIWLCEAHALAY